MLLRQYDKNRNGRLSREEWTSMRDPERYNVNGDSSITLSELVAGIKRYSRGEQASKDTGDKKLGRRGEAGVYRIPSTLERLEKLGMPTSFSSIDQNGDGQIQMSEFASTWTMARVAEFQRYDTNSDWVVTPQEWLAAEALKRQQ